MCLCPYIPFSDQWGITVKSDSPMAYGEIAAGTHKWYIIHTICMRLTGSLDSSNTIELNKIINSRDALVLFLIMPFKTTHRLYVSVYMEYVFVCCAKCRS